MWARAAVRSEICGRWSAIRRAIVDAHALAMSNRHLEAGGDRESDIGTDHDARSARGHASSIGVEARTAAVASIGITLSTSACAGAGQLGRLEVCHRPKAGYR